MSTKMSKQDFVDAFEHYVNLESVRKHYLFPLQKMEINGKFHHYMDSDTDSAFVGFQLGYLKWKKND